MCESIATSFRAYIIGLIMSIILIYEQTVFSITIGFFILTYITIQVLEGLIWIDRKNKGLSSNSHEALNGGDNTISSDGLTRAILVALWLQPLIQTYFAYKYHGGTLLTIALIIYGFLFLYALYRAFNFNIKFGSLPFVGKGHLSWTSSDGNFFGGYFLTIIYLIGLFFGLLFTTPTINGVIFISVGLLCLLWSRSHYSWEEVGSMWCLYAVGLSIVAWFLVKISP